MVCLFSFWSSSQYSRRKPSPSRPLVSSHSSFPSRFQTPLETALFEEHERLTAQHWGSLVFCEERFLKDRKELWSADGNPSHHFERAALQIRATLRLQPRARMFPAKDGMRVEVGSQPRERRDEDSRLRREGSEA